MSDVPMRNPLSKPELSQDEASAVVTVLDEISGLNWSLVTRIIEEKGIEPDHFVDGANKLCRLAHLSNCFDKGDF